MKNSFTSHIPKIKNGADERMHPFTYGQDRSAAFVDAALTLLTHSAKIDNQSIFDASDLLDVRILIDQADLKTLS